MTTTAETPPSLIAHLAHLLSKLESPGGNEPPALLDLLPPATSALTLAQSGPPSSTNQLTLNTMADRGIKLYNIARKLTTAPEAAKIRAILRALASHCAALKPTPPGAQDRTLTAVSGCVA